MTNITLYDVIRILNYVQKNKIERPAGPRDIQEKSRMSVTFPITLRFIKPQPTTEQDDEVIRITPYMADGKRKFLWRYSYETRKTTQVCILDDEFFLYQKLRSLVDLLAWDSDPYASVQVLLPTTPSVLFRATDFPDAIENVIESMRVAVRHWPVAMATVDASKMAISGQKTLTDSPGSFTRSGCCYTPTKKAHAASGTGDDESVGPPPLVPLRKCFSHYDYDFNTGGGKKVDFKSTNSGYSYFGKPLNPEDEYESPWET
jgi:hypothetical protein